MLNCTVSRSTAPTINHYTKAAFSLIRVPVLVPVWVGVFIWVKATCTSTSVCIYVNQSSLKIWWKLLNT